MEVGRSSFRHCQKLPPKLHFMIHNGKTGMKNQKLERQLLDTQSGLSAMLLLGLYGWLKAQLKQGSCPPQTFRQGVKVRSTRDRNPG